jgi:hypothetical protein
MAEVSVGRSGDTALVFRMGLHLGDADIGVSQASRTGMSRTQLRGVGAIL